MRTRALILTEIIAPYRIPVFNALAARADIDLHVIFLSETDAGLRQWHVYKNEIQFSYEVLPAWRMRIGRMNVLLNRGLTAALRRARPDGIVVGGYNYLASWQAALWARRNRVPLLLWSESTAQDSRHQFVAIEWMKHRFVSMCSAFVAAGKTSRAYLLDLGAKEKNTFVAPDAVDVKFYSDAADHARAHAAEVRAHHGLPQRYFLFLGRLVEEKGVFDLLAAYAKLDAHIRSSIDVVVVGEGAAQVKMREQAARIQPGAIHFCGWKHREEIPEIYALADAFIFPTHSDPWGLVVNEAMSCALPIVATDVAGCVPDLVAEAQNGFVVPSNDPVALAAAMSSLAQDAQMRKRMGIRSREKIQKYSPEACAQGLANAVVLAKKRS